ncbi:MAG: lactate dehydrogenase [Rhizobiaceae bacterium]|nr:lactate dehydrogenase [Rhizobiaceae bacterium]
MNAVEIEMAVSALAEQPFDADDFPFAFLRAFGNPLATIKRLRSGSSNKSDQKGILQRNNIHLKVCDEGEVTNTLVQLKTSPATTKAKAKFVLATDGSDLEAEDLTSGETIACAYKDFPDHFGFFLPLAGISTVKQIRESAFDIKATGRLNRLYLELLKDNPEWGTAERRHDMNHIMARLIFCFFAEDTDIFTAPGMFTGTIERMSEKDSSNTHAVISELFRAMNTRPDGRPAAGIARWAMAFPYVNGGLFSGGTDVPHFSRIARAYLIHIGSLDWTKINPDIFGSMIQAVADDEERGALGMHYTSVPNILKVLNPLFLDDLHEKLEEAGDNPRKLLNLRNRIAKIRVFDPACGSGNFLVIAYKEMRAIEAEINVRRDETDRRTEIPLTNYRGIELRDFPAEIARLALIIAEYQCDVTYRGQKEALAEFLPLDAKNWITCGNALRLDWLSICPPTGTGVKHHAEDLFMSPLDQAQIDFENEGGETYICGNPPFAGQKKKTKEQRDDMAQVMLAVVKKFGELDYVCPFFVKASQYLKRTKGAAAFVSTNSIVQGRQVPVLWPSILEGGLEIIFGHRSFLWKNSATKNASVYCVVVGLGYNWQRKKYIYEGDERKEVSSINGYLTPGSTVGIVKRKTPLSKDLQPMKSGNMPLDNGNLLLSLNETRQLLTDYPSSEKFIKPIVGAKEINQGLQRYCLWIGDHDVGEATTIPPIAERLHECRLFRESSSAPELAGAPHAFRDRHKQAESVILLPNLSSERRRFRVPIIGSKDIVATNLALAIYDGEIFQVSILASRMHHLWVEAVCGKFKQDFRYSNDLGWHTFPLPKLLDSQKTALTKCSEELLLVREQSFPACLNDLYNSSDDDDRMPADLRATHDRNDEMLERIYIGRRFRNDTERLEKLFELYSKMTKLKQVA